MSDGNGKRRNGQVTKGQLVLELAAARARAEEAEARATAAEAAALARPATATPPPGGHRPEAWLAPAEGVLRLWITTDTEGYRLRLVSIEPPGWEVIKWSDGTRYHLHEAEGRIHCDCPGGTAHGPECNGGKGCKHARMIRALRQVVDPGL
jgi:hypothetical protein